MQAALAELGGDVTYLGILQDDQVLFKAKTRALLGSGTYDIFVSTGAVSIGNFDFEHNSL